MHDNWSKPAKKSEGTDLTWDEWTDVLGNTYRPGDIVAVAIINDRSPQQVIGEVLQINRKRWTDGKWTDEDGNDRWSKHWEEITARIRVPTEEDKWHHETVPSCTVRVQPLLDARGFSRSVKQSDGSWSWGWDGAGAQSGEAYPVTYLFPANIIRLPITREELEAVRNEPRSRRR